MKQKDIDKIAKTVSEGPNGIPDDLNRWKKMTPAKVAANEAAKQQINKEMKVKHRHAPVGPKEQLLRDLRQNNLTEPDKKAIEELTAAEKGRKEAKKKASLAALVNGRAEQAKDEARKQLGAEATDAQIDEKAKAILKEKARGERLLRKAKAKVVAKAQPATEVATTESDMPKLATSKKVAPKLKTSGPKTTNKQQKKATTTARTAVKGQTRAAGPSGMTVEILKLASRKQGATRSELIALTKWEQQAWKWYFENSKNSGACQRWGYKLKVIERPDGATAYHVTKK
jgi:hypothetical protein